MSDGPIFIQTSGSVINVAKILRIDTPPRGQVTIKFEGGKQMTLPRPDAEALCETLLDLAKAGVLGARRAAGVSF